MNRPFSPILLAAILLSCGGSGFVRGSAAQAPKQIRAGAAAANVTPWLGLSINGSMQDRRVNRIHDELHARSLALDDGRNRIVITVVDSCMISREIFDEAKRLVAQHTGLPAHHMLMSATHTHSAPTAVPIFQSQADADYLRFLTRRIADSVRRALDNLQPAEIGWGMGKVPEHVFNRRWKMKPGTALPDPFGGTDQVKMNPPAGSPDLVEPAGPTDPDLSVLSVRGLDGRPIALMGNYSLHYVGAADTSADYFGVFADRIRELLGAERLDPPFVGILSNGTSGNINNVDFRHKRESQAPFAQMRRVADDVAQEALRVYKTIKHQAWVPLDARQAELELGVRRPGSEELRRARQIVAAAKGPAMQTQPEIYARETLLLADYPEKVPVLVQGLRIGDLGIGAIPCEVFVEIGLELKKKSALQPVFIVSLANGYNGYLPTVEHHRLGGYETWRARSSYLEVEAAPRIVDRLLTLLSELKGQKTD
jgi:neutral ceramidase